MARELKYEIWQEKKLAEQIDNALQGNIVRFVLNNVDDPMAEDVYRSEVEGHSMKVDKKVLGNFYALCQEVKNTLDFHEPVDFYVTGDASINASSRAAEHEDQPHIVNINSALFTLMNEDEMRFVIGHELGHLINKDMELRRLIFFVFPPDKEVIPLTLRDKIHLHDNLAELVADRYGFLATGNNLEASVTAFYKLQSGLNLQSMQVSIEDLLEDNRKHLEYFLKGNGVSQYDHPVFPIRVEAIRLFATSKSQAALERGMDELIGILMRVGDGPREYYTKLFMATAGLLAAQADGKVVDEEIDAIYDKLSEFTFFPKEDFKYITKQDYKKIFEEATATIMKNAPQMARELLEYVIEITVADKTINEPELNFIFDFGQSLGMSIKDVSYIFAMTFRKVFNPSIASIA